jgi:uncharacterized protein (TIGR04255 family)
MPDKLPHPLGGPPPDEINLPRAPLVRVIAQIVFPGLLKIDNKDVVASFQEAIRKDYPLFEQQSVQQLHLRLGEGQPVVQQMPGNVWCFFDAGRVWRLILNNNSVSLDTVKYESRKSFISRLTSVISAVEDVFDPQIALRLGLRYIDRVVGDSLNEIDSLVRSEIMGIANTSYRPHVRHSMTEALVAIEEGEMLLRWGLLSANATIQPGVLDPVSQPSWILDIDVYSVEQRKFESEVLRTAFVAFAERAYSVFRHMTTGQFLTTYGAQDDR